MHSIYGEAQILCTKIKFFSSTRSVSILILVLYTTHKMVTVSYAISFDSRTLMNDAATFCDVIQQTFKTGFSALCWLTFKLIIDTARNELNSASLIFLIETEFVLCEEGNHTFVYNTCVKFALEQAMNVQRDSQAITLLFL
jgi:hypothetical protein